MQVFTIFANNRLRNNQYIIEADMTLCIDPFDGEQVSSFASEKFGSISLLLNTHQHHDHIRGNKDIISTGAKLLTNESLLSQELVLSDRCVLSCLHTPGHTLDSYSYLVKNIRSGNFESIFLGDTLFHLGVGNCYNGGDSKILAQTIMSLDNILIDETHLYIGHDYFESNLKFTNQHFELPEHFTQEPNSQESYLKWGEQKKINPFLRVLFDKEFRKKYYGDQGPVEAFMNMRDLRDKF